MVSEKLDRVLAAESEASSKIKEAEKRAEAIISEAREKADGIIHQKKSDAKAKAAETIGFAVEECDRITEEYNKKAEAEADRITKDSARKEMFGMNTVIMKIIP